MAVKNLMQMVAEMIPGEPSTFDSNDNPQPGHYVMTPYGSHPKVGHKLISTLITPILHGSAV